MQRANASGGVHFLHAVAIIIVGVRGPGGTLNAVLGIVHILIGRRVVGEVAGCVISKATGVIIRIAGVLERSPVRMRQGFFALTKRSLSSKGTNVTLRERNLKAWATPPLW